VTAAFLDATSPRYSGGDEQRPDVRLLGGLSIDPAVVGVDPYGQGWLFRVAGTLDAHAPGLLDAAAYRQQIGEE
jgi:hypothetical protein